MQTISNSHEEFKDFMNQRAEELLRVNQISRNVKAIRHTVSEVSESQASIKNILKDLHDIINDMNRPDGSEPQDLNI